MVELVWHYLFKLRFSGAGKETNKYFQSFSRLCVLQGKVLVTMNIAGQI